MASTRNREIAAAILVLCLAKKKKTIPKRKKWVKSWIERRKQLGAYHALVRELKIEDGQQFRNFCRFSSVEVEFLVELVGPIIFKKDTAMREAISVRERLMVALLFFATGKYLK